MTRDIGYVYIILHKESNLYKIGRTINKERRFKELEVGTSTKLINSYRVFNHKAVEKLCHKMFADKRLPQTEYFKLTEKDLSAIELVLLDNKYKTKKVLRAERDAEWIRKLKAKRFEYTQFNSYKKFTSRHANKLSAGIVIPIFLLIFYPLFIIAVEFLKAWGLNQWFLVVPTFIWFYWVLWLNDKQDKEIRDQLFVRDEESLIKEHLESMKRLDKAEDDYEMNN